MANILIIDDQPCVRQLISEELILEGYQVHGVGDVESVREHLQFLQLAPVFLDLYLEGSERFGLLEEMKRECPHLPVIIVSAYDSFLDDPRVSLADGYVIKSIHLYTLKENIACVLIQQNGYRGPAEAGFRHSELCVSCGF
ncbi:MAG: response regulator [Desulfobacterales bacterium]|nr:MAG: response regulator [Desulfobacterales bacterium]